MFPFIIIYKENFNERIIIFLFIYEKIISWQKNIAGAITFLFMSKYLTLYSPHIILFEFEKYFYI